MVPVISAVRELLTAMHLTNEAVGGADAALSDHGSEPAGARARQSFCHVVFTCDAEHVDSIRNLAISTLDR